MQIQTETDRKTGIQTLRPIRTQKERQRQTQTHRKTDREQGKVRSKKNGGVEGEEGLRYRKTRK